MSEFDSNSIEETFKFSDKLENVDFIFEQFARSQNSLITSLGNTFFVYGEIQLSDVEHNLMLIKNAVEDGSGSDEMLIQAAKFNSFTLVLFLVNVINAGYYVIDRFSISYHSPLLSSCYFRIKAEFEDIATRSLAMIGNIFSEMWVDFSQEESHIASLVHLVKKAGSRVTSLTLTSPSTTEQFQTNPDAYMGYDERDKADYNMDGYDNSEEMTLHNKQHAQNIAHNEELIMMWLLLLSQIMYHPLAHIKENIEHHRAMVRNNRVNSTDNHVSEPLDSDSVGDTGSLNILAEFLSLSEALLAVAAQLPEEAYLFSVKVVAMTNYQFPLPEDNSCEIATVFSRVDAENHTVNISQGLLHVLNENGYPSITTETPAVLRLCTDLLYVHSNAFGNNTSNTSYPQSNANSAAAEESNGSIHKGHFYTNDIKVMVDVCLRELRNIPYNATPSASYSEDDIALHGMVRYMYLELIDAILQESSWATAGNCYLKEDLKALVEEMYTREEDCERRDFAFALLYKYKHLFNAV